MHLINPECLKNSNYISDLLHLRYTAAELATKTVYEKIEISYQCDLDSKYLDTGPARIFHMGWHHGSMLW